MKKRETILLAVLGVVVVVAIIIFFAASQPAVTPENSVSKTEVSTESVMTSLAGVQAVMNSDKFATLSTYGKIPVVVEPFEMGNKNPLNPSR